MTADQEDAAIGFSFLACVVLAIIFGNDDWTGAGIGLGCVVLLPVIGGLAG